MTWRTITKNKTVRVTSLPAEWHLALITEAATGGVLYKKVFLEISQNSQENTCARDSFLITLQGLGLRPATLLK